MRRPLWKRIRWHRVVLAFGIVACLIAGGCKLYAHYMYQPTLVEYTTTAQPGDTVYSICSKVATDEDDLMKLIYQTEQDNGIKNGKLLPGQVVTVRVEEARKQ